MATAVVAAGGGGGSGFARLVTFLPSFLPSSLPSMADLSLPLGRLSRSNRPAGLPAGRPGAGGRLLSTGSLQGVPALFSFPDPNFGPFNQRRLRGAAKWTERGKLARADASALQRCSGGGSGGGRRGEGGQRRAKRGGLCDCEANAPPLPPRQEKLLKRRIFLSGSQSVSQSREENWGGDGETRRCLVRSDASRVCDNNLAAAAAASYMC